MQSATHQMDISPDTPGMDVTGPVRPEPFVSKRLYDLPEMPPVGTKEQPRSEPSVRAELAAAFKKLGRGIDARAAYERAKDFYKSSGHRWTRGLR